MKTEHLIANHPEVFHVASATSWPSIERFGLLSTSALLELHGVSVPEQEVLLRRKRDVSTTLSTPGVGVAVIRDQKPLKFIHRKIESGSSLSRFLEALNSRVYFAPTRDRLQRLLWAREYRGTPQVVITVDTGALIDRYENRIELCRFNSGACTQLNHPVRGHESWLPIPRYPYEEYRRRYKGTALVEVTVPRAVPDLLEIATRVEHIRS